jgi:molecular chaperone GrpE
MVFKEFEKVFEAEGVKAIEAVGKECDPMCHEVLGVMEAGEEDDGKIIKEAQRGFICDGKVLRPARVFVAKQKENTQKEEENEKGG